MILLDLKLPKVDGLEVLRRIRADDETKLAAGRGPHLVAPRIATWSSRYELGANSYVRKPVDFDEVRRGRAAARALLAGAQRAGARLTRGVMGSPLRLLVVEDSDNDYALVVREIGKCGYDVSAERVETAEAMTAALDRGGFDLVVSDFQMPAFSGPAALALLRERDLEIPFIIVSGTIGEEVAVESLKAGANDFLTKQRLARLGRRSSASCARPATAARAERPSCSGMSWRNAIACSWSRSPPCSTWPRRTGSGNFCTSARKSKRCWASRPQSGPIRNSGDARHIRTTKGADEAFARLRTTGAAERAEYRMFTKEGPPALVRDEARLVPWADRGERWSRASCRTSPA